MSEALRKLDAIEGKLLAAREKKAFLLKKRRLDDPPGDKVDLDTIEANIQDLKELQNLWMNQYALEYSGKGIIQSRPFTASDKPWISQVTEVDLDYRHWVDFQPDTIHNSVFLPEGFRTAFENIAKAFQLSTEARKRVYLNLFLSSIILLPEFENCLRIFPELNISANKNAYGLTCRMTGKVDYTVGFSRGIDHFSNTIPSEVHLLAFEAKSEFTKGSFTQCVAETAALYRIRKTAGKSVCRVWGVFSDASSWIFLYIDEDGLLWQSDKFSLQLKNFREVEVLSVYRGLYFVLNNIFLSRSPPLSPAAEAI